MKSSPEQALAGRVSPRAIPPTRLFEAFQQEKCLKAHPKTGEVEIQGQLYLVPDELRGQKLTFLLDPAAEAPPQLVDPQSGQPLRLRIAEVRPDLVQDPPRPALWGEGPLQTLYDSWRGLRRPQAEPGSACPRSTRC